MEILKKDIAEKRIESRFAKNKKSKLRQQSRSSADKALKNRAKEQTKTTASQLGLDKEN